MGMNYILDNNKGSVHAEIALIEKHKHRIPDKINMLVIRMTKTGKLCESRPCYHCMMQLLESGINIKYIYYSTASGEIHRERFSIKMLFSDKTYISLGNRRKVYDT